MIETNIIVTPGRCVLGGVRVSGAVAAQPRDPRWTEYGQFRAPKARVGVVASAVVGADQPKHVQVPATSGNTSMTLVPTGVPPSALERRT